MRPLWQVKHRSGGQTYALKSLKKQHVVDTKQQEHVVAEANIMRTCRLKLESHLSQKTQEYPEIDFFNEVLGY